MLIPAYFDVIARPGRPEPPVFLSDSFVWTYAARPRLRDLVVRCVLSVKQMDKSDCELDDTKSDTFELEVRFLAVEKPVHSCKLRQEIGRKSERLQQDGLV